MSNGFSRTIAEVEENSDYISEIRGFYGPATTMPGVQGELQLDNLLIETQGRGSSEQSA
jgi:hypothetical protein